VKGLFYFEVEKAFHFLNVYLAYSTKLEENGRDCNGRKGQAGL
jgi:hypothetical protein